MEYADRLVWDIDRLARSFGAKIDFGDRRAAARWTMPGGRKVSLHIVLRGDGRYQWWGESRVAGRPIRRYFDEMYGLFQQPGPAT